MRFAWLFAAFMALVCLPATAQEAGQDRDSGGYLQRLLEDSLSGAGREVRIRGFRGALSSQATLQEMTIADADGVWLTLQEVELDWRRAALLRGRIEVNRLSAALIEVARPPAPGPAITPEDAVAQPFALPDLPVSVNIGEIRAETLRLGAPLLGREAAFRLSGHMRLEGGEGSAALDLARQDGRGGLTLDAGFDNASRVLGIDLQLEEDQGGVAATLLGLPDTPALALSVAGKAPLTDYRADIALSTDGQDRLAGLVEIRGEAMPDAGTADGVVDGAGTPQAYRFRADLGGDLRPLFQPEFHAFFGADSRLHAEGLKSGDGTLDLSSLTLSAQALNISGRLRLGADGWPERFALEGRLGEDGGAPVRLPLPGPTARLDSARIDARFDAAQGDLWQAEVTLDGFARDGVAIDTARMTGKGSIAARAAPRGVSGQMSLDVGGLHTTDAALAQALGDAVSGRTRLAWAEGAALQLQEIDITAGDARLRGDATLDSLDAGFPTRFDLRLSAADLTRFAALARQDLAGAADARITGSATALSGAFDITLEAGTQALSIGQPQVDPVLRSDTRLTLAARRDESGTTLDRLKLDNDDLALDAAGTVGAAAGQLQVKAGLREAGRIDPRLDGPASFAADLGWRADGAVSLDGLNARLMGARLTGDARLWPGRDGLPAEGRIMARIADLARFADLAGQPLQGVLDLTLEGAGKVREAAFDVTADAAGRGLVTGIKALDGLLDGRLDLSTRAARQNGVIDIEHVSLVTPQLRVTGTRGSGPGTALDLRARIAQAGRVDSRLDGPATAAVDLSWLPGDALRLDDLHAELMGARIAGDVTARPEDPGLPVTARITTEVADLSRFAAIAGQPLRGTIDLRLDAEGHAQDLAADFALDTRLEGRGLRSGIAALDRLLSGSVNMAVKAGRDTGVLNLQQLTLTTPQLTVAGSRGDGGAGAPFNLRARLADLGLFVPGLGGEIEADGRVDLARVESGRAVVNLSARGPGGLSARVTGDILDRGQRLDLAVAGVLPLALANPFISPNALQGSARYDLRVAGAPGVDAVSGRITTEDTRLALPGAGLSLDPIGGSVALSRGRATLDLNGGAPTGGRFGVAGTVALAGAFDGDLDITLSGLRLADQQLYATRLDGRIGVTGPLTGGARIAGAITLGETEIRVPSSGTAASVDLPDLRHRNEPSEVRGTRARAGLIVESKATRARPFPLDLEINAPGRIFVRGRGLDAELGGRIRLRGDTNDVVPGGFFELVRGRLDVLGQRFVLSQGLVDMRGSLDPYLRFVADTKAEDVTVQIIIEGLASAPEVSFRSQPDLPQEEVVARLLFGRGLDKISPLQAAQLAGAVATLSGRSNGGALSRLRGTMGLSDLDVTSTDTGATEVRAGAYISENIYSEVTADSEGRQKIELNLDLTRSLTVKGGVSNDGDTGVGIFFERDY